MNSTITAIVVVAYNRPKSLKRLLTSLSKAEYNRSDIPLIISIDHSDSNSDVLKIAKDYKWKFGNKIVQYSPYNLGLKNHIIKCGNYAIEYGSVIVLEDDLFVSPLFYKFSRNALNFSSDKPEIGGVSLYNHQFNVHKGSNFRAIDDGFDNWYFQFASSWGQAWSKNQWESFLFWFKLQGKLQDKPQIPKNVTSWSNKSWLKYYTAYLIEHNKYFFYPKISYSTNFSDQGTHAEKDSSSYQVPLLFNEVRNSVFSDLKNSKSMYDAFFENSNLYSFLGFQKNEICIDLYGYRNNYYQRYILTTKKMNFRIIKTYGRSLKPIDANVLQEIEGNDIFLYDSEIYELNKQPTNRLQEIIYNIKIISVKDSLFLTFTMIKKKIFEKFKKY